MSLIKRYPIPISEYYVERQLPFIFIDFNASCMSLIAKSSGLILLPLQVKGAVADPGFLERRFICIKVWGFALLIYLIFLKYPMK